MPNKQEKERMIEYIGNQLYDGGHKVENKSIRFSWNNQKINYLKVDDKRIIFMINNPNEYTGEKTNSLLNELSYRVEKPLFVFYKDENNFFRNHASQKNSIKQKFTKLNNDRSLKNYSTEDLKNSLLLSEAERKIRENRKGLQYYQPKSERLEEMLIHYDLEPFIYDYSHKKPEETFGPIQVPSKKLYFIDKKVEIPDRIEVGEFYLRNPTLEESISS